MGRFTEQRRKPLVRSSLSRRLTSMRMKKVFLPPLFARSPCSVCCLVILISLGCLMSNKDRAKRGKPSSTWCLNTWILILRNSFDACSV